MLFKGIIINLKKEYAIVLTDQKKFVKVNLKNSMEIGQKILFTQEDILQDTIISTDWKEFMIMSKKYLAIAAGIVILATAGIFGYNYSNNNTSTTETETQPVLSMLSDTAASVVTIDINPSIELFLDTERKVIDIKALNEDAATLDLAKFIGLTVDEAVEGIVALAKEKDFIDAEDLDEDYVLVTIVDINEDDEDDLADLEDSLNETIEDSEELQDLNVALLKATQREIFEAEGKDIPLGLYIINGMIEVDGEYITIKEFFANPEYRETFKNDGKIYAMSEEKKAKLTEKYINQLENEGVDVTELQEMINAPDANMGQIMSYINKNFKHNNENDDNDDLDDIEDTEEEIEDDTEESTSADDIENQGNNRNSNKN